MNGLLAQGIAVMFIGMGTVLLFLCVTIMSMNVMSIAVGKLNKLFPEAVPQTVGTKSAVSSNDNEIAAAIIAALFRKK